ncbi:hypothetical protein C7S18_14720 [Ahniella affigens]|uniref:Uncharacterized protein n=1 Tax=Ahniella affigens TaxID=2021234 RepID=A0A2P1PU68_9GAMM|nr:hypothetical protein [Ahniella affigens]AVP98362.1 hypothetical protein C7S18_14720 [Ahniella affigens]
MQTAFRSRLRFEANTAPEPADIVILHLIDKYQGRPRSMSAHFDDGVWRCAETGNEIDEFQAMLMGWTPKSPEQEAKYRRICDTGQYMIVQ